VQYNYNTTLIQELFSCILSKFKLFPHGGRFAPMNRLLLSCYRQSIETIPISALVRPKFAFQILTPGSKTQICPSHEGKCSLRPHECPCRIASHSIQWLQQGAQMTYGQMERPRLGNTHHNRWHYRFQGCHLKMNF